MARRAISTFTGPIGAAAPRPSVIPFHRMARPIEVLVSLRWGESQSRSTYRYFGCHGHVPVAMPGDDRTWACPRVGEHGTQSRSGIQRKGGFGSINWLSD